MFNYCSASEGCFKRSTFFRIQELLGFVENLGSQLEPDAGEVDI